MTRLQRTALAGAALAAVIAGFVLFSRERVPEYGGRDAWSWFHQFQSGPGASPLNREAEDAFAAMGDAATPFLWSVINQPDPGRIRRAWDHLKAQLPWRSNRASWPGPQRNPQALALQILERIHPSATALWPLIQPAAASCIARVLAEQSDTFLTIGWLAVWWRWAMRRAPSQTGRARLAMRDHPAFSWRNPALGRNGGFIAYLSAAAPSETPPALIPGAPRSGGRDFEKRPIRQPNRRPPPVCGCLVAEVVPP